MTRRQKTTLATVCVLILTGSAFLAGRFHGRASSVGKEVSYRAVIAVYLLDRLYAGDTSRSIAVLDGMLDQDTYSMAIAKRQPLLPSVRDQIDRVLPRVVRFRQDHPRKPIQSEQYRPGIDDPSRETELEGRNQLTERMNQEIERVLAEAGTNGSPTTGRTVPPKAGAFGVQ